MTDNKSTEESQIDRHLFEDAFNTWLEVHGVKIGEELAGRVVATIDLYKLKIGIIDLLIATLATLESPEAQS